MKTFRYHIALLTVAMMAMAINVQAQDDERALGAAADTIIRTETRDYIVNRIVESVYQSHPTASLATRIAKAYYNYNEEDGYKDKFHNIRHFHKNDTVHAFKYIRRAIELDPKYAPAYILASDIVDYDGNTEEAQKWLKKGIDNAPKDSSLYIASATILARDNVDLAIAQLQHLKDTDPNFPINLHVARIYDKIDVRLVDYRDKVAEYYGKASMSEMTQGDMETYAMSLFYSGQSDKCCTVSEEALRIYPRSLALNRFYLRSLVPQKKYSEALTAFVNLKMSENPNPNKPVLELRDYINYAAALVGTKQYDAAMDVYDSLLVNKDLATNDETAINNGIRDCMEGRMDEYVKDGKYDEAISIYKKFVEDRRGKNKLDGSMLFTYAGLFQSKASKLTGDEQKAEFQKADKVYEGAISEFSSNELIVRVGTYYRLYLNRLIDNNNEKGNTVPHAEKLISLIENKANKSKSENTMLVYAYDYLMRYYLYVKNSTKDAALFAEKILDIDPANQDALTVLTLKK